ncbi:MAG: carbohydrate-binding domain-containing protein [Bacteroidales bacterium]|nr:carbohydrate-binding domain-containing protein [Bacteroidales bacterium]
MDKIFKLLFSAALLLCCIMLNAQQPAGDGSQANPYQLTNYADLQWFAAQVNGGQNGICAKLNADIAASGTWTPIGNSSQCYRGDFDGDGHTISGLSLSDNETSNVGLFGKATDDAHIHHVGVVGCSFSGKDHVGGICGDFANGVIEYCYSTGTIYALTGDGGGLTGSCYTNAHIRQCHTSCAVTAGAGSYGGITGYLWGDVNHCCVMEGKNAEGHVFYGGKTDDAVFADNTAHSEAAFASGEVCWLLNNGVTDGSQKWYQTLGGTDNLPVLDNSHGTVYYGYDGNVLTYSNSPLTPPTIDNVAYIDADGVEQTAHNVFMIRNASEQVIWSAGWYVVQGADITLAKGAVCNGEVHLILADGAKLTATGSDTSYTPGIQVSGDGNSLAIYGQSAQSGELIAKGGNDGAGIGGQRRKSGSNITINGGVVTANGGKFAAGIGGGQGSASTAGPVPSESDGFNITINGGDVTATGGMSAAGIGGGFGGDGSHITITGGNVTATGVQSGAGIGGGAGISDELVGVSASGGSGSYITITGGTVTATGGGLGASGIGSGDNGSCSDIFVATTHFVYAGDSENPTTEIDNTGSDLASSLAGKRYATAEPKPMFTVTYGDNITVNPEFESGADVIYGTEITFTADSDDDFLGFYKEITFETPIIDGVNLNDKTYTVTVIDAAISVYAKFYDGNPIPVTSSNTVVTWGITNTASWYIVNGDVRLSKGAVCNGDVRLILADGAKLTAKGTCAEHSDNGTPGIKVSGEGNSLTIYGQTYQSGQLIATGANCAAGIGGGNRESGSNITINGGIVMATGSSSGAGIGGGNRESGSNITINGGVVTANGGDWAAGIGGGHYNPGSHITINGGTVTANGGQDASCIGGGDKSSGSDIKVDADLIVRAGNDNPPATEVAPEHTSSTDIANDLAGKGHAVITSKALPVPVSVAYIDENGIEQTTDANAVTHSAIPVTWGTAGTTTWYVVNDADVQLACGAVCNGDVRLILADGAKLTATGANAPGIQVSGDGNSLTVYSQTAQTGQLFANGGDWSAGIGGGYNGNGSNITIYGGVVTATGGKESAGIGGGQYGSGSNITIKGGIVTATGNNYGAGIGGGNRGSGSDITIVGSEVTASGGDGAAGIGGGREQSGSDIIIKSGTVTATGGDLASGIGGGYKGNGSKITIDGGTITATAGKESAGIGGGQYGSGSYITINDGVVTATGDNYGAGIGGGRERSGSDITVKGGTVTATGGDWASGIGGGWKGDGSKITIDGGTVTATAGKESAGIGGGQYGSGWDIKVAAALTVYADNNNPPMVEIPHTSDYDIAINLAGKRYAVVKDDITGIKQAAIAAINAAIEGVTNADIIAIANYAVDAINAATSVETINALKEQALAAIASAKAIYASGLGEMGTPCTDCPAVDVTKGTTTIRLYSPEKVEFRKME